MPWIVAAIDGAEEKQYVVKMFTPKTIEQQFAVAKEVLGNVLAREFSLTVPDYALIKFGDDFMATLDSEQTIRLNKVHGGLKFATLLESGAINFSPAVHKHHLQQEDFANVYAYDCLMYNVDRGRRVDKPNVLVNNNGFFLIDHEQSLHFADEQLAHYNIIIKELALGKLDYPYKNHLFYSDLCNIHISNKANIFDEFLEYLRNLNTKIILDIGNELNDNNVSTGNYRLIFDYFCI